MKKIFTLFYFSITSMFLMAADINVGSYTDLFRPILDIMDVIKILAIVVLTLSLIAQGVITFLGNNMSDIVKKTISRVAVGGCFIGGAVTVATLILGSASWCIKFIRVYIKG